MRLSHQGRLGYKSRGRERERLLLGDENHRLAPGVLEIQMYTMSSILEAPTSSTQAGVTKNADWGA